MLVRYPDDQRRVCLVTGAAGRLGSALCEALAEEYDIVGVYRSTVPNLTCQFQTAVDPLVPSWRGGRSVFLVQADLTVDSDLRRVVEVALARHGGIDLLVNGAAKYGQVDLADELSFGDVEEVFNTNVLVPLKLAAVVARQHWSRDRAATVSRNRNIVNVSSTAGLGVNAKTDLRAYGASKAALNTLSGHMAHDYARLGVRVNALAPTAFPRVIATAKVVEAIAALDRGQATGTVTIVDEKGSRFQR